MHGLLIHRRTPVRQSSSRCRRHAVPSAALGATPLHEDRPEPAARAVSDGAASSLGHPASAFAADGSENGDKCSWVNVANRTFANGFVFPVQPYWSNIWRSQYGYGGYFG